MQRVGALALTRRVVIMTIFLASFIPAKHAFLGESLSTMVVTFLRRCFPTLRLSRKTMIDIIDMWHYAPQLMISFLQQLLGITEEDMHETLCDAWGCRCSDFEHTPTHR
jgi:hypothetical protein